MESAAKYADNAVNVLFMELTERGVSGDARLEQCETDIRIAVRNLVLDVMTDVRNGEVSFP